MEFNCTDIGNAERFEKHHGNSAKFISEQRKWVYYHNGWHYADIFRLTKPVVRSIYKEAFECKDQNKRPELGLWAKRSENRSFQRNMADIAADFMNASIEDFDADPRVINCRNGIVDLKTKTIIQHSPEQLHLKKANANYDPSAQCPKWIQFLYEIFNGDIVLIQWLQVALGYSIMGLTTEHCFFLCHGNGRNGKGTLLETVGYILGDYSLTAKFETFLQRDISSARALEAVGNLKGQRFIIASETSDSTRLNEALIKELTGGDRLRGAKLGSASFQFYPTHTIWFACNHRPAIKDASLAMWERVKAIPFINNYVGEDQEKNLKESLKLEADGIFAWLVHGANEYLTNGLPADPDGVKLATTVYRDDNDKMSIFIRERMERDVSCSVLSKDVHPVYSKWCIDNNEDIVSLKFFPSSMEERGIKNKKTKEGIVFMNWRLKKMELVTQVTNDPTPFHI